MELLELFKKKVVSFRIKRRRTLREACIQEAERRVIFRCFLEGPVATVYLCIDGMRILRVGGESSYFRYFIAESKAEEALSFYRRWYYRKIWQEWSRG